ncbi:FadR family transcriptional regulator [Marivibrio halodurans]|uniref:FadR family transcriptional regulator n=1 Tax=Marivibrio halodurans TaxID=2039722 RepID=A0A8J7SL69_9PROT|nr:FCD domain-containing protein [Marivibrio halodurans]MBP5856011.1 FadR family transcriptional regulator [Marivibrio halodurans]
MAQAEADRFERISAPPAYQLVAEAIEREIVSGRIPPDTPIGTEADLAKQFGVNRSTVREGIRCLEQSGLIRREPSRRLVASVPRHAKLATRVSRALILHQVSFRELYEAIDMLERNAIELAVTHRTGDDLDALSDNLARTRAALDDPERMADLDTEFHTLIARASGNRVLQLAREPVSLLIYPATQPIFEQVPEAADRLLAAHEKLFDALSGRNMDAARLWMRRHVADFGKGFRRTGRSLEDPVDRVPLDSVFQTRGEL